MNYKEQKRIYLESHPDATLEEAYESGYQQCVRNWCVKEL